MKSFLISSACVLVTFFILTEASVYRGYLEFDENGPYCEGPSRTRMEVGEKKRINCFDCSCSHGGLACHGVGYNGGRMYMQGCRQERLENCCYQMVKRDDPSQNCTAVVCPNES